jgi:uncharacterized membrane protein YkvI
MSETSVHDAVTDAIRYWEKKRIAYNAILLTIVLTVFASQWPESRSAMSVELLQGLFLLAVMANVFYSTAYIVDVVAQHSGFRDSWRRRRWILFAVGAMFASILARFISLDILGQGA